MGSDPGRLHSLKAATLPMEIDSAPLLVDSPLLVIGRLGPIMKSVSMAIEESLPYL